jgi:biotin carboxylase
MSDETGRGTRALAHGVIVNADFSGLWLAEKFRDRGINLTHVETQRKAPRPRAGNLYEKMFSRLLVCEPGELAALVPIVASADFVLAGSEAGVEPADQLNALVPGRHRSAPDITPFVDKAQMYSRAAAAGLATPLTHLLHDREDIARLPHSVFCTDLVVKPAKSYGSDNVHFCYTRDDVYVAVDSVFQTDNYHGEKNQNALLQERIYAPQCFVNSVSLHGEHFIVDIWARDRAVRADTTTWTVEPLARMSACADQLSNFVCRLLDTLGMNSGASHTELFLTERGPVLLETSARHAGRTISERALRQVFPVTQLDLLALSCADPRAFRRAVDHFPGQAREAAIVPFFAPHPGWLQSYFDLEPLQALESFHSFEKKFLPGEQVSCSPLLGACIGFLLLCHSSRQRIVADLERIRAWRAAGGLTAVVKAEQSEIAIVKRPAST